MGRTGLAIQGGGPLEVDQLLKESLYYLVLHEIGHTLGLNHNFRASQLHSLEDIHDREKTDPVGLLSSVMDYPAINFSSDKEEQGAYYTDKPGPYDVWAIQFGYDQALGDPAAMAAHLARSTEPALAFANDADDMRSSGKGIDPRAMLGDLTSDPVGYAIERINFVRSILPELVEKITDEGETWEPLRSSFSSILWNYGSSAQILSRQIGGVHIERALVGQAGDTPPLQPVSAAQQRRAMEALKTAIVAEDAFVFPEDLLQRLQLQRRGFDHFELEANEDPKLHAGVAQIQSTVLDQLLHPNTLQRIIDTSLYGNEYPLDQFLAELDDAVMTGDTDELDPNTFRQSLQIDYFRRLIKISGLEKPSPGLGWAYTSEPSSARP